MERCGVISPEYSNELVTRVEEMSFVGNYFALNPTIFGVLLNDFGRVWLASEEAILINAGVVQLGACITQCKATSSLNPTEKVGCGRGRDGQISLGPRTG